MDWRATFKPESIVRESSSRKSMLVRFGQGVALAANENPEDTLGVSITTNQGLETLFARAEMGEEQAANRLAESLRAAVSRFSQLCRTRPKLFQHAAARSWRWPVMMSLHPYLCDDYETIFHGLKLGVSAPLELHPSARWVWDGAADVAFGLLTFLWEARSENRNPLFEYGKFGEVMDRLPKFTSDSAPQWWEAAKDVFLLSYPEPQSVPELAALVKSPSKRRSPGRIKQTIFDLLKARFIGFARPNIPE